MRRWWIPALAGTMMIASSHAEETAPPAGTKPEPAPAAEQAPTATPAATAPVKRGAKQSAKGRKPREKDAEGSEAADRFEADTVIKSKYKLNGESLEVDPD